MASISLRSPECSSVGKIQCRSGAGFQQKTVQRILIAGKLRGQKLQSDLAPKVKILCFVNDSHPAAAELAGDAVMRDGLPDDGYVRKFILGGMQKAVKLDQ
jgi:hypothetical protein